MNNKRAIPLPEKRISIKKSGNCRYVYYVDEYYVTPNGTRTHKDISIGKLNEDNPKTFFPNKNYAKLFPDKAHNEFETLSFKRAGFTQFTACLSQQLDLNQLLERQFGDLSASILSIASYMLAQGNSMMYLDDYYQTHINPYRVNVSQHHLGPVYEGITLEKRWKFFQD